MKNCRLMGFTLIEVMVVIVIMGILAAIAVPKLFGNVAKAKASELPIAAATYIKLQDISVNVHNAIGNWHTIGYDAPGKNGVSAYFTYSEGEIETATVTFESLGEGKIGWQATNTVGLNNCLKDSWWTITLTAVEGKEPHLNYNAQVSSDKCLAIASSFTAGQVTGAGSMAAGGSTSGNTGNNSGESGNGNGTNTNLLAGVNVFANGAVTVERGGWNGDGMRSNGMVNKDSSSTTSVYNSVLYTYNTGETEPGKEGLFKLEPNSTYTFTFSDPESEWTSKDGFLQADIRVFTNLEKQEAATIMCGTTTKSDDAIKADYEKNKQWATTGANTSSKSKEGFDAVGTYDPVTKTTTFTITTGSEASYFGANFRKNGGSGFATSSDAQRQAAQTAIENASLVKTGSSDGSKTAAQIAAENKEKEENSSSK